ncbi:hypothetical protein L596_001174 [Steinernema carpocapsae]|uniref:Uncharacterized protein n=1 Tax=Steinernema carpocapsae TaxID=34508 RepID=A0A4U8UKQ2_STECR|nr:hypothetical protein L596_001174 [Steinernema carpocapsae]
MPKPNMLQKVSPSLLSPLYETSKVVTYLIHSVHTKIIPCTQRPFRALNCHRADNITAGTFDSCSVTVLSKTSVVIRRFHEVRTFIVLEDSMHKMFNGSARSEQAVFAHTTTILRSTPSAIISFESRNYTSFQSISISVRTGRSHAHFLTKLPNFRCHRAFNHYFWMGKLD